jgi:ferrous-iron efflux pump FieF
MLFSTDPRARKVALNVSLAALVLAVVKGIIGFASGSIAVLSSALDSAGDAIASFANFIFLRIAAKPPDEGHQFGHGKAEHLAALLQGLLLLTGAAILGYRAAQRIRTPAPLESNVIAIAAMIASMAATVVITRYLKKNAVRSESSALAGDALHYTSDLLANGAAIVALALVRVTGNPLYDSIFGVTVACWIAWSSIYLIWNAANDLMDAALPDAEVRLVIEAIERSDPIVLGYRDLRTRRAAGVRFIEFELCIDSHVSFERAHDATELVKTKIRERIPRSVVIIHAEPDDGNSEFKIQNSE